jgi:hypothetical protein
VQCALTLVHTVGLTSSALVLPKAAHLSSYRDFRSLASVRLEDWTL